MSERDLRRIEVLSDVRSGRRTVAAAAAVLAVSERQAFEQRGKACTLLVFIDDATSRSELADKLPGQYVEVYDFADRPSEVRWKGHSLPYRVFSKDQRVSHTATVENKRLGHALKIVKTQQEIKRLPKIMTNSDKGGYQKRGRQLYGPTTKRSCRRPKLWKYAKSPKAAISHIPTVRRLLLNRRTYTDISNGQQPCHF